MRQRAVFLDRDGVINRALVRDGKPYPPGSLDELEILPGVPEALARLHDAGFRLIVATNQPDVARGLRDKEQIDVLHQALFAQLPLDEIRVCYHDDSDNCQCRKPKPGLLLDAAKSLEINLHESFMIGDRWRDIDAGNHAGCMTVFIDYDYAERKPQAPTVCVDSLAQAVEWILARGGETHEIH